MRHRPSFACALLLAACHAPPATVSPKAPTSVSPKAASALFAWPTPAGWKAETIPFPLEFAPTLHYRGVEEVRFAPHFFEPSAETYFSYSFAWVMDDAPSVAPEQLAEDMRVYFAGLASSVGGEKHATYDPGAFNAHIEAVDAKRSRGVVNMVDAFGDGRRLALNLDAESSECGGRRVLIVSLSPRPPGDAVWGRILEQRGTFRCAGR